MIEHAGLALLRQNVRMLIPNISHSRDINDFGGGELIYPTLTQRAFWCAFSSLATILKSAHTSNCSYHWGKYIIKEIKIKLSDQFSRWIHKFYRIPTTLP
jgi:hypothetical protein